MKKLSVLFTTVLMFSAVGVAKAQKIASLDMMSVLNVMPEKKAADAQIQALTNTKAAELDKQKAAAQAKFEQYQKEAATQKPEVNKQREEELQKLQENLQAMAQAAQKDMAEKQDAAYSPIEKKLNDAIGRAAKANGWDFIFDSNNPSLIYKSGPDATVAVKKELGL